MDPTANLEEQRQIIWRVMVNNIWKPGDADRLAELSEALDQWISRGGFLPGQWKAGR